MSTPDTDLEITPEQSEIIETPAEEETPAAVVVAQAATETTDSAGYDDEETESDPSDGPSFSEMFEASLREQPVLERGQIVKGIVASRDNGLVMIDVGAKAEGSVPLTEFAEIGMPEGPQVGDEIEVLVRSVGGQSGVQVSVLEARKQGSWSVVQAALDANSMIDVLVESEVKGGYRVNIGGLHGFMPKSEADLSPRHRASDLIGKTVTTAILSASRKPENIVVSRRKPLEEVREHRRDDFFESIAVGSKVTGKVKRLADFGAFVDLDGVDALLHVSDISWKRLNHPGEALTVGQVVTAEVIKLDRKNGKVSLSLRNLQADPWETAGEKYEIGMHITGTVRRLLEFGAMVELEPGIEGMIHRSELSWSKREVKPIDVLAENDVVDVAIKSVDTAKRRIALSLREVAENPWQQFLSTHPAGSRITGKVRSMTEFGLFVALDTNLDGLVHLSNLSWEEKPEDAMKHFKKGLEVEAVVLGVDIERQRISLGIKQAHEDPFEVFMNGAGKGGGITGVISSVEKAGFRVELAPSIYAFLPLKEVPRDAGEFKAGESIEAKIIEVDRKKRQVVISVRQHQKDEERKAVRNYSRRIENEGDSPSPLAMEIRKKLLNR